MDLEEDTYSSIFLALKHPVRRKILKMLNEDPATYTQILNKLKVETGFLNYHLESLDGLVTKNEHDKYILSDFGEAALSLMKMVEEPVKKEVEEPIKRRSRELKIFGFKVNPAFVLLVAIAVLILSNVYWVYNSQELSKDKTNALGGVLIQTRIPLGESIYILNTTAREGRIEFELWDALFGDLIQLSRQYAVIISLDNSHRYQWLQIKEATDSLMDFVNALTQTYAKNNTYMEITSEQSTYLNKIGNSLLSIQVKVIPSTIVIGSNPQVNIIDSEITEAVETSILLQASLKSARRAFNLPPL